MNDLIKKACEIVIKKYETYEEVPEKYKYFYREYKSTSLGKRNNRDWYSDEIDDNDT